jgi:hypothetical protein
VSVDWWPHPAVSAAARTSGGAPSPAETPVPAALGYVRLAAGREGRFGALRRAVGCLEQFALAGGYGLGQVFVDDRPPYGQAWDTLLDTARSARPVAVLLPALDGARPAPLEIATLQAQLAHVTTAPLLLARPAPPDREAPDTPRSGVRWGR